MHICDAMSYYVQSILAAQSMLSTALHFFRKFSRVAGIGGIVGRVGQSPSAFIRPRFGSYSVA